MKTIAGILLAFLAVQTVVQDVQCQAIFEKQLVQLKRLREQAETHRATFRAWKTKYDSLDISRKDFLKGAKERISTELRRIEEDNAKSLPTEQNAYSVLRFNTEDAQRHKKTENDRLSNSTLHSSGLRQCFRDSKALLTEAAKFTSWALEMLDSNGRPGPGFFEYRTMWPGSFDECVAVRAEYEQRPKKLRTFRGRYCNAFGDIIIPGLLALPSDVWGLCLPDSCNSTEAFILVYSLLKQFNISEYRLRLIDCHEPIEMPAKTIAVISLVLLLVALVTVATAVDLLLIQWPKWKTQEQSETHTQENGHNNIVYENGSHELTTILGVNSDISEYKPGLPVRLLLTFSAWTNGEMICATSQHKDALGCLNGIRVISMSWVILGHSIFFMLISTDNILSAVMTFMDRWTFQAIINATFCVDSFFVLSGLLVSYPTLSVMKSTEGKISWFSFYFHRYLRLTPAYMLCLAVYVTTLPFWMDGPFYPRRGINNNFCETTWWKNLLYIQNFFHDDTMCFSWSWYLSADMCFYVLSPLMIAPLHFRPVIGFIIIGLFFLATTVTPFVLTMLHYFGPGVGDVAGHVEEGDRVYDLYFAPYCRMGPYLEGILLGYVLNRTKWPIRISRVANITGWCVATATALAVLYGLFEYGNGKDIDLVLSAFYNGLSRSAWGLCVAWVIFSCVSGKGGLINSFLSMPVWIPLGRLTYTVFLIHPILTMTWAFARRTPYYLDDLSIIMVYLACLLAAYSVGFIVSLVFEAPFMGLEKILKKEKFPLYIESAVHFEDKDSTKGCYRRRDGDDDPRWPCESTKVQAKAVQRHTIGRFLEKVKDVSCDPGLIDSSVFSEDLTGCFSHCCIEGVDPRVHVCIIIVTSINDSDNELF
ncbi:nose resistant to fluoxetine protein 6-like [Aplysia californica]|uniref:Nose resistant to fluoxetine protein 6-like n=1 Tax=Aplysia californica TaxID=6500 RepID=A0ABM0ZY69_APLCA|nr:nose resistant to fluoxetine protein 6-like [Aplysia californica]